MNLQLMDGLCGLLTLRGSNINFAVINYLYQTFKSSTSRFSFFLGKLPKYHQS